ncbi:MAG: hypothetical protein LDL41_21790, partial [Coleofasciculus sp. S288]|nr:hypothetical protein [Coleofasciculus sp. S288]
LPNSLVPVPELGCNQWIQMRSHLFPLVNSSASAIAFESTDCNQVLEQVLENLEAEIDASGAVIIPETLPSLRGDETQLTQLFQNLISNAIKFRRKDVPPQIKISVEKRQRSTSVETCVSTEKLQDLATPNAGDDEWVFGIHDNGIGVEPQYFERIFQVFQRLHTCEDYPGTGIGLAICKKIVERHRGNIWLDSSLEEGTTFYFTIPIQHTC